MGPPGAPTLRVRWSGVPTHGGYGPRSRVDRYTAIGPLPRQLRLCKLSGPLSLTGILYRSMTWLSRGKFYRYL